MEDMIKLLKEKNEIDNKVIIEKNKIISMRNIAIEMLESGKLSLFLASWLKTELIKQIPNLHATSVPIEVIASELDKMSNSFPEKAYETFEGLNSLLIGNEVWKENAPKIRNRILEKMQKQMDKHFPENYKRIGSYFGEVFMKGKTESLKQRAMNDLEKTDIECVLGKKEGLKVASSYRLAENHKANFAKIISAAYGLHMFEDETGKSVSNKQKLMDALGSFFGTEYKNLPQLLNAAKQNGNYTEIFDKLKKKAEEFALK